MDVPHHLVSRCERKTAKGNSGRTSGPPRPSVSVPFASSPKPLFARRQVFAGRSCAEEPIWSASRATWPNGARACNTDEAVINTTVRLWTIKFTGNISGRPSAVTTTTRPNSTCFTGARHFSSPRLSKALSHPRASSFRTVVDGGLFGLLGPVPSRPIFTKILPMPPGGPIPSGAYGLRSSATSATALEPPMPARLSPARCRSLLAGAMAGHLALSQGALPVVVPVSGRSRTSVCLCEPGPVPFGRAPFRPRVVTFETTLTSLDQNSRVGGPRARPGEVRPRPARQGNPGAAGARGPQLDHGARHWPRTGDRLALLVAVARTKGCC